MSLDTSICLSDYSIKMFYEQEMTVTVTVTIKQHSLLDLHWNPTTYEASPTSPKKKTPFSSNVLDLRFTNPRILASTKKQRKNARSGKGLAGWLAGWLIGYAGILWVQQDIY